MVVKSGIWKIINHMLCGFLTAYNLEYGLVYPCGCGFFMLPGNNMARRLT